MANSFEPTRALLRECLEYPGESYATLRAVVGVGATSVITGWLNMGAAPKRQSDWPAVHRKLESHLVALKRRGADSETCDLEWRTRFTAYLHRERVTAADFAVAVGTTARHGARWERFGEIPLDLVRSEVERRIGFDFACSAYRRSVRVARERFRAAFPPPLDAVERVVTDPSATAEQIHAEIQRAVVAVRERSGKTSRMLASEIEASHSCVGYFCGKMRTHLSYGAGAIAGMLVGLARYIDAHPEQFIGTDQRIAATAVARALEILTARPQRPKGSMKEHTTVRWDRIAEQLRAGTHRFLGSRCRGGELAAVVFVRLCIAYEQSRLTTAQAVARLGLSAHQLAGWFNGRTFPDYTMLPRLEELFERLEGKRAQPSSLREVQSGEAEFVPFNGVHPSLPLEETAAAAHVPALAPAPSSVPASEAVPVVGGAPDFVIAMASMCRGLEAMRKAGWRPSEANRRHLASIARAAVELGGLTASDFDQQQGSEPVVGGEDSPAMRALRDAFSQLRGTRAPREQ